MRFSVEQPDRGRRLALAEAGQKLEFENLLSSKVGPHGELNQSSWETPHVNG